MHRLYFYIRRSTVCLKEKGVTSMRQKYIVEHSLINKR